VTKDQDHEKSSGVGKVIPVTQQLAEVSTGLDAAKLNLKWFSEHQDVWSEYIPNAR
jgi:hypothetical protein